MTLHIKRISILTLILILLLILLSCANDYEDQSSNNDDSTRFNAHQSEIETSDNIVSQTSETSESSVAIIESIDDFDYDSVKNFNKNSGGYIIAVEDVLYCSNREDGNRLYKKEMSSSNQQKIGEKTSDFLLNCFQYYENKLFYLNTVKLEEPIETEYATVVYIKQIVCYNMDTDKECVLIDTQPVIDFVVADGYIYYTTYDEEQYGALYRLSLFDNSTQKLTELIYPMTIQESNDKLYLGFNESLSVYDIKNNTINNQMMLHYGYAVYDDIVYFLNINDCCVYKMEHNEETGSYDYENIQKLSDIRASSFNIYGDNLILSDFDRKTIYCINSLTAEETVIAIGHSPIITPEGISYKSDDGLIELYKFQ